MNTRLAQPAKTKQTQTCCCQLSCHVTTDVQLANLWVPWCVHQHFLAESGDLIGQSFSLCERLTCDFVSTELRHCPLAVFHILMHLSLVPPPVASMPDCQGHQATAYEEEEKQRMSWISFL